MRHIIIDPTTNIILNVIEWDGVTPWSPPEGTTVMAFGDEVGPGWIWDGAVAHDPAPVTPESIIEVQPPEKSNNGPKVL